MKTAKKLQIIAFALFAAAFVLSIVCIFTQDLIRSIYHTPDVHARMIPYPQIISRLFHLILALVWLLMVLRTPDRKKTILITIVISILYLVYGIIVSPIISSAFAARMLQHGQDVFAAYNAVTSFTSTVTSIIASPASILMFLSLGIACGVNLRTPSETD